MTNVRVCAHTDAMRVTVDDTTWTLPVGSDRVGAWLTHDPPLPDQLTNAIGEVIDHFDDVVHQRPDIVGQATVDICGVGTRAFADVELGAPSGPTPHHIARVDVEEVFRIVATESRQQRAVNPGLGAADVDIVVVAACVAVGVMRRLHSTAVTITDCEHPA